MLLLVRRLFLLGLLLGFMGSPQPGAAQTPGSPPSNPAKTPPLAAFDPASHLSDRVQDTPATVIELFQQAGMSPRAHPLTAAERRLVDHALAGLPPLHQRVLKAHLRSVSFLDNMPNTALTSAVKPATASPLFDLTIRAGILPQTVSEWLTEKERTCFAGPDTTWQVQLEGGRLPALDYVLLHEATHVVDAVLHLTPASSATGQLLDSAAAKRFTAGIWQNRTVVVPRWRQPLLQGIAFRRGGKALPVEQAEHVYHALQRTPFVSLYGSSAWTEDLAEYVAVAHFTQKLRQPFRIVLRHQGQQVLVYEPMKAAGVRRRLRQMKRFYA